MNVVFQKLVLMAELGGGGGMLTERERKVSALVTLL